MRKSITSLLFFFVFIANAQEITVDALLVDETAKDSIVYNKTTTIAEERTFSENLKETYSGKDFEYKEDTYEDEDDEKEKEEAPSSSGILEFFIFFMTSIFPFLLGGFVIFVILKAVLGSDIRFWKTNNKSQKLSEKLIYEDEDIHEINLEKLLQQAIENKEFRLAIRYYYLSTLKILSNKQVIDYHKDKTNSEYLFEINNTTMRTQFSYLSYVYAYVWYGEFPVDENSFKVAENKYQSFLKSLV